MNHLKHSSIRRAISLALYSASSLAAVSLATVSYAQGYADEPTFNRIYLAELSQTDQAVDRRSAIKKDADHPFAETQFLEHVGSVELLFGVTRFDSAKGQTNDSNSFVVGEGFSYANKSQPLLIESRLDSLESRYSLSEDSDQESDIFSLGLGMFIKSGLMVGFKYDRTTSKIYKDLAQIDEIKSDQYDVFTKYVRKLGNGKALNFEASFAIDSAIDNERGDNQTINISGDYYVNQQNSIGFGLERITSEEDIVDGDVISFELRSYITPKFSVAAGMEKFSSDNLFLTDDKTIDINFNARF